MMVEVVPVRGPNCGAVAASFDTERNPRGNHK